MPHPRELVPGLPVRDYLVLLRHHPAVGEYWVDATSPQEAIDRFTLRLKALGEPTSNLDLAVIGVE